MRDLVEVLLGGKEKRGKIRRRGKRSQEKNEG